MSVEHDRESLRSFGRCASGASEVYKPTSIDEVLEVYDLAKSAKPKGRIAIRGGGHSFDGQALHEGDTGAGIVLSSEKFNPDHIHFDISPHAGESTVTLGGGVRWGDFVRAALDDAPRTGAIRIPGSLQTGRKATAGGTLAGDCLSRFSGLSGKESAWIESFGIVTPLSRQRVSVTAQSDPDLFYSAIGGLGYLGFVTDVTYRLIEIDPGSVARSHITLHRNFHDLIQEQLSLIAAGGPPRAISSCWFQGLFHPNPDAITGAVFDSIYTQPSSPMLPGFLLYDDIDSPQRRAVEIGLAREELTNFLIHEFLLHSIEKNNGRFEDELFDFWFFMDGNTVAKEWFEKHFHPALFPIAQQTYVVPVDRTEAFAINCMSKMQSAGIRPTECDMLYVEADDCFMSANYGMNGFAITIGFEPIDPSSTFTGCPPHKIPDLLKDLSVDCFNAGGRIHLTKNVNVAPAVFRSMFSPQIGYFERVKRYHDPDGLLQNTFSDTFFQFEETISLQQSAP